MKKFLIGFLIIGFISVISGCQRSVTLPQDEASEIGDSMDEKVENMLVGLSENDYEQHTRDFEGELDERIDRVTFPQVYEEIIGTLGAYRSKELLEVQQQTRYMVLVYDAKFEQDSDVIVRIVYWITDPEQNIAGVWFESDLLQGK